MGTELHPIHNTAIYPSVDPGIEVRAVDEILSANQDVLDRIQICYGMGQAAFERDMLSLVRRFAQFVHLLPATPDNFFNVPGGLLRMGLEIAFFALQGTDGHIFSGRSTITVRRHLEPRWRYATFIAGLCGEIHGTLTRVIVTDNKGTEWHPYLQPLAEWLDARKATRFFLKWRQNGQENRSLGVFVLPQVISADIMQFLAQDNDSVVPHMMSSISGMPLYREHNIVQDLVRRATALVIDRFLQTSMDRYGVPQLGSHLERYLVDAMRRLHEASPEWKPNVPKSRIWYGRDGLFARWPDINNDIQTLLDADQLPGIPKSPDTVLEILIAAGVFVAHGESKPLWEIVIPGSKAVIDGVKFASPAILFARIGSEPEKLHDAIEYDPANKPVASQSTQANRHGGPKSAKVTQLILPIETEAEAPVSGDNPSAPTDTLDRTNSAVSKFTIAQSDPPAAESRFALCAPMRMNPTLKDALTDIIDTLNHDGGNNQVFTVANGVFIALDALVQRQTNPAQAIRLMAEMHMLIRASTKTSWIISHEFSGRALSGVVLDPKFVFGLNPDHFAVPESS